jgi:hypothetical protein
MIEAGENGDLRLKRFEKFENGGQFVVSAGLGGKKRRRVKSEHVADAHHAFGPGRAGRFAGQGADG